MLVNAFDLEDTQYVSRIILTNTYSLILIDRCNVRVLVASLPTAPTPLQEVELEEKRVLLRKRIASLCSTLSDVLPESRPHLDVITDKNLDMPETISLPLPSLLVALPISTSPDWGRLLDMEKRLRHAYATDSLEGVRRAIGLRDQLHRSSRKDARGQHAATRAQAVIERSQKNIDMFAERYRRSRHAYILLGGGSGELRELKDGDIRSLSAHQDAEVMTQRDGPREGHRTVSWIYTVPGAVAATSLEKDEGDFYSRCVPIPIHLAHPPLPLYLTAKAAEYSFSKARWLRWKEEEDILTRELERTVLFFQFRSSWWLSRIGLRTSDNTPSRVLIGLKAYASRLSLLYRELSLHVKNLPV